MDENQTGQQSPEQQPEQQSLHGVGVSPGRVIAPWCTWHRP